MLGSYSGLQGSPYEDAISNGAIGISEGLDRWNPNMSSLTSYVWIWIRREVLKGNREDWNKGLVGEIRNKGGAPVNYDPNKQWSNNMDGRGISVNEIDRAAVDPEANPVMDAAIHMELNDFVREKLTPVQQKVIKLLYVEDMTQAEAGLIIGRTQQRVDQIHREALEVLRSIYL
jgi:RNA polymerase sigma factor (sigma-70 family)